MKNWLSYFVFNSAFVQSPTIDCPEFVTNIFDIIIVRDCRRSVSLSWRRQVEMKMLWCCCVERNGFFIKERDIFWSFVLSAFWGSLTGCCFWCSLLGYFWFKWFCFTLFRFWDEAYEVFETFANTIMKQSISCKCLVSQRFDRVPCIYYFILENFRVSLTLKWNFLASMTVWFWLVGPWIWTNWKFRQASVWLVS